MQNHLCSKSDDGFESVMPSHHVTSNTNKPQENGFLSAHGPIYDTNHRPQGCTGTLSDSSICLTGQTRRRQID